MALFALRTRERFFREENVFSDDVIYVYVKTILRALLRKGRS